MVPGALVEAPAGRRLARGSAVELSDRGCHRSAVTATPKPKDLVLILAREFASKLAFAVLISDADGNLVYFNEPAERLLGRTYAETGELSATQWAPLLKTEDLDGSPLPLERLPGGIALLERRPAHRNLAITGLDGVRREISATAFPLLSSATELVGMIAIFWRLEEGVSG
jgi:PAS domain-containing protein